jgi:hypothetical protein
MAPSQYDDESIVGEECHIIARDPNGPRGNSTLPVDQRNAYDNLILLCSVHHKLIDDQVNIYSVDKLKELRKNHEAWVSKSLGSRQENNTSHADTAFVFRIEKGKGLLDSIAGSHLFYFENDQPESEEEAHLIGDFLQNAQDYIDIWDAIESKDRVLAQFNLEAEIQQLESAGFLVYGSQNKENHKIGGAAADYLMSYLFVLRKTNPIVARKDARLEIAMFPLGHPLSEFTSFIVIRRG